MSSIERLVGHWEWDILNDRITWSEELYRIYGLEPREFRPSYDAYVARIHPADRRRIELIVRQAMRDGRPYDFQHRVIWPDGTLKVVAAHGEVERGADGRPIRIRGTTTDITDG